jgi:Cof subfamily protein (haloacid dehalogenase superfamily)
MRIIATDLDGTLLRRDHTISRRTAAVLDRITAGGGRVVLVTGRPLRWLQMVYDQLSAPVPTVSANGAVVYDPVTEEVLRADPLDPEVLLQVCQRLREQLPEVLFAVEVDHGRSMLRETEYGRAWDGDHVTVRPVRTVTDLCAAPAVKLLVRAGGQDPDEFAATVTAALDGMAEATHSSYSGLVEISAAGVTKAAGLAWLCERWGVPATDVLAFGDMPNDVPMLTWAGHAVAVANAHATVKAVADELTGSNEDDGVAAYLERAFPDAAA